MIHATLENHTDIQNFVKTLFKPFKSFNTVNTTAIRKYATTIASESGESKFAAERRAIEEHAKTLIIGSANAYRIASAHQHSEHSDHGEPIPLERW
ncbi:9181_t:CDS:2 [Diversispora eburnea]|uniref:9181_t:CDS:1 n=1 Tax=Diversispora eburnea TaxID=1213867 RepID=A0A9N9F563_9GLOM|nr:9181_t:CDS:2 [Diversispora eburnea]